MFDMGSTLLNFHNPEWEESIIAENGHNRMIHYIAQKYGYAAAEKIDTEVIIPWYKYIEHNRKQQRLEYRICEALFLKFGQLGISISYAEILEILKKDYLDFYQYAHPNAGVIDCLAALKEKECKIGVVSNIMYLQQIYLEIFKRESFGTKTGS